MSKELEFVSGNTTTHRALPALRLKGLHGMSVLQRAHESVERIDGEIVAVRRHWREVPTVPIDAPDVEA